MGLFRGALRVAKFVVASLYPKYSKVLTIHEFFPAVPPGHKIIEVPSQVIYLPDTVKSIDPL